MASRQSCLLVLSSSIEGKYSKQLFFYTMEHNYKFSISKRKRLAFSVRYNVLFTYYHSIYSGISKYRNREMGVDMSTGQYRCVAPGKPRQKLRLYPSIGSLAISVKP